MPDLVGLFVGECLALATAIVVVPCCYATRRKEERLRSRQGAWAWAAIDGVSVWMFMAVVIAALWIDKRLALGFLAHLLILVAAIVTGGLGSAFAAKRLAPPLMRRMGV